MAYEEVSIRTADGDCPTHILTPEGEGPWPVVIIYMDAGGIRPTLIDIGRRLAENGYLAVVPDLFYRAGPYSLPTPKEMIASGDFMKYIAPLLATTNPEKAAKDTGYLLEYLAARGDAKAHTGTVGFCMGGGMAVVSAATYPDRIVAVASFHGGRLATDEPDSPHLSVPKIKAELYIAGADKDDHYPVEQHERLKQALDEAGVTYRAEIYEGALHGWMKPDFPVYDEAAAERGWKEMLDLFERTLG
ncbi:dienelactone hydrolase family protein [Sphingomonas sp. CGMCC 1.13654]|uniref:Dienelactone hydrolase family protein n=1 Tax=Sphingomonas chungangi TaxID=2683589 RepID=A0A838L3Y4_9SPHN|nr:dienelactone hydrolase family protein [Sphingomonas chungangi]MBA2932916.1 dienelactone hydrolase family protein [Sphingomonas chungangi]MVW56536.1 dienelactone hydrolase family protein [Sphingomonas chungangi]